MSVIESNRTKSPLETSVKARDLACYTIKISINEKIFDPQYKTVITDKIVSDAIDIYRKVWMANNIKANKNQDAWTKRSKLQIKDITEIYGGQKMRYRVVDDPKELRAQERAQAQAYQNQANIDFIALLTGVDLGDDEEVEEDE